MSIPGLTNIFSNPNPKLLNFNLNCLIKFRVCAKTRDYEVNFTSSLPNSRIFSQFSAPVMPSSSATSKQRKEEEDRQNYYVNMGYAIRCLREEFPELFHKEPSFDIYRDDIVFKDPLNTFSGIENYKTVFQALRFHGRIFFKALWIEILSVWQPMDNVILVRWTVYGIPRVPWESRGRFDGISEYKLDKNGKIYEHKVDNIALNSPRKFIHALSVEEIILSLSQPSTPEPTCFESAFDFSQRHQPEISQKS